MWYKYESDPPHPRDGWSATPIISQAHPNNTLCDIPTEGETIQNTRNNIT